MHKITRYFSALDYGFIDVPHPTYLRDSLVLADQQRQTYTNCADTGCSLEDLSRAMDDRDR